ncbi:hypothetical protein [Actinoplanes solisilvae]|uniref:hypothetical protein n=1 Tax=Actinoplanes solisilvae TaxID=2486853 RepID=UPI000FDB34B3|nr:hypothetical protein [Actinoplanes solisilvae]
MTEPGYDEWVVSVVTRGTGQHRNRDVIGLQGWVLHGDSSSLTLRFPARPETALRVALVAGGEDGEGRLSAERLGRPVTGPAVQGMVDAFLGADDAIRQLPEADRSAGCSAAALTIGATGPAVAAGIGRVQVFRLVDGYFGQLTRSDSPGGLGTLNRSAEFRPAEFSTLTGDRLIIGAQSLADAEIAGVAGRSGPWLAQFLVDRVAADEEHEATVIVVDVVGQAQGRAGPPSGSREPARHLPVLFPGSRDVVAG